MLVLIVIASITAALLLFLHTISVPGDWFLIGLGLVVFAVVCVAIGMAADTQIQSTKPIKPTLKINCTNSKCDTIYVYEEPGDNS